MQSLHKNTPLPLTSSSSTPTNPVIPNICDWSLELSHPGTLIVGDNVVRDGEVIDPDTPDPNIQGVRRFTDLIAAEHKLARQCCRLLAPRATTDLQSLSFFADDPQAIRFENRKSQSFSSLYDIEQSRISSR